MVTAVQCYSDIGATEISRDVPWSHIVNVLYPYVQEEAPFPVPALSHCAPITVTATDALLVGVDAPSSGVILAPIPRRQDKFGRRWCS